MNSYATMLLMALHLLKVDRGKSQADETENLTCHKSQQDTISRFGLSAISKRWYPACLPGGYYRNVQCNSNNCFCAYLDTGGMMPRFVKGNSVEEMMKICPWRSEKPPSQCGAASELYPCSKFSDRILDAECNSRNTYTLIPQQSKSSLNLSMLKVDQNDASKEAFGYDFERIVKMYEDILYHILFRYYFDPNTNNCVLNSKSCLGFVTLEDCETACNVYKRPPIRCMVGEMDSTKDDKCVKRTGRPGIKSCMMCNCEEGYELSRDRSECVRKAPEVRREKFSCSCEYDGLIKYKASDSNITVDKAATGEMILRCNAPEGISNINWSLNRVEFPQNCEEAKYCISRDGRYLNLWDPDYTYSGKYECLYKSRRGDQILSSKIIIPVSIEEVCGRSPGIDNPERAFAPRIIGGIETKPGMAPFMAQIVRRDDGRLNCGGSIISTSFVVTAAQCFSHKTGGKDWPNKEYWLVKMGKLKLDSLEARYEQSSAVKRIIMHEDNTERFHADIALLELEDPVYFSKGVKPICIPFPNDVLDEIAPKSSSNSKSKYGLAFGWGSTDPTEVDATNDLMEVSLPIVSDEECREELKEIFELTSHSITDLMFCAGGEKNKDTCVGDTGGPLALWSKLRTRWYLGGITSFGYFCASGTPAVYTKIATELRQWIYRNSNLNIAA